MAERRSAARVEPSRPAAAKVKTSLPARVLDISSHGAQLEVANCLKPNVTCELRLLVGDGEVSVRALVRRCRAWGFGLDEKDQRVLLYRAGIEFAEIRPEALARLRAHFGLPDSGQFAALTDEGGKPAKGSSSGSKPLAQQAPRQSGPVKIRISSDHVRKILDRGDEE